MTGDELLAITTSPKRRKALEAFLKQWAAQ
jgi:hypothetical protein